jgi:hypothetical protein
MITALALASGAACALASEAAFLLVSGATFRLASGAAFALAPGCIFLPGASYKRVIKRAGVLCTSQPPPCFGVRLCRACQPAPPIPGFEKQAVVMGVLVLVELKPNCPQPRPRLGLGPHRRFRSTALRLQQLCTKLWVLRHAQARLQGLSLSLPQRIQRRTWWMRFLLLMMHDAFPLRATKSAFKNAASQPAPGVSGGNWYAGASLFPTCAWTWTWAFTTGGSRPMEKGGFRLAPGPGHGHLLRRLPTYGGSGSTAAVLRLGPAQVFRGLGFGGLGENSVSTSGPIKKKKMGPRRQVLELLHISVSPQRVSSLL